MQSFASETTAAEPASSLMTSLVALCPPTSLLDQHPEPRHIFRLWQVFVESVNPLTKILHVPTFQQRLMDASWALDSLPTPTEAIMFAVYTLAITAMRPEECQQLFGESHTTLLNRYRTATIRALVSAGLLTTRDLDVFQAFVLFLVSDPESEATSTLTAMALHIGHRMGLHETDESLPFFEQEMRVRAWWQLHIASRRSGKVPSRTAFCSEIGPVRLPLNVNDADLHPAMTAPPVEHPGPTEMLYVLMKYEATSWVRTSPAAAKLFSGKRHRSRPEARYRFRPEARETNEMAIRELEALYETKYLSKCDPRIPLHAVSIAMSRLSVARWRFLVYHPRHASEADNSQNDALFENAVAMLQLADETRKLRFAVLLLSHMTERSQTDAFVYVLSELRRRCTGAQVEAAWRIVEGLYRDYPELVAQEDNAFYAALGDLALDAWEARLAELVRSGGPWECESAPRFIKTLRAQRERSAAEAIQAAACEPLGGLMVEDPALNWDYWDDLMRL